MPAFQDWLAEAQLALFAAVHEKGRGAVAAVVALRKASHCD